MEGVRQQQAHATVDLAVLRFPVFFKGHIHQWIFHIATVSARAPRRRSATLKVKTSHFLVLFIFVVTIFLKVAFKQANAIYYFRCRIDHVFFRHMVAIFPYGRIGADLL